MRRIARIFLDTSYLLPIFRIAPDIKGYKDEMELILNDSKNSYYYSSLSLIEIKWKFIKLEKIEERLEIQGKYNQFQNILLRDNRFEIIHHPHTNINVISDEIRNLGHKDYIDTIIGASSIWFSDILITEDKNLKEKVIDVNENGKYNNHFEIFNWRELKNIVLN